MTDETGCTADADYRCGKCGVQGEWNPDCTRCQIRRHIAVNHEAYRRMGAVA